MTEKPIDVGMPFSDGTRFEVPAVDHPVPVTIVVAVVTLFSVMAEA